jgi:hypothetical protein
MHSEQNMQSSANSLLELLPVPNSDYCVRTILCCFYKLHNLSTLNLCHVTSKFCTVASWEYAINEQNYELNKGGFDSVLYKFILIFKKYIKYLDDHIFQLWYFHVFL